MSALRPWIAMSTTTDTEKIGPIRQWATRPQLPPPPMPSVLSKAERAKWSEVEELEARRQAASDRFYELKRADAFARAEHEAQAKSAARSGGSVAGFEPDPELAEAEAA